MNDKREREYWFKMNESDEYKRRERYEKETRI